MMPRGLAPSLWTALIWFGLLALFAGSAMAGHINVITIDGSINQIGRAHV